MEAVFNSITNINNLTELKKRKDKKALSNIISITIILILSILAISVLFIIVNRTLIPMLSPQVSCFDMKVNSPILIEKACYNNETNDIEIALKRISKKINIDSIGFIISSETESSEWTCSNNCLNCEILEPGTKKVYYFNSEDEIKTIILRINECVVESKKIIWC